MPLALDGLGHESWYDDTQRTAPAAAMQIRPVRMQVSFWSNLAIDSTWVGQERLADGEIPYGR